MLDGKALSIGKNLVKADLALDPKTMLMDLGLSLVKGDLVLDGKAMALDEDHFITLVQANLTLSSTAMAVTVIDPTQILSGNVKGQKNLTGNVKTSKSITGTIE